MATDNFITIIIVRSAEELKKFNISIKKYRFFKILLSFVLVFFFALSFTLYFVISENSQLKLQIEAIESAPENPGQIVLHQPDTSKTKPVEPENIESEVDKIDIETVFSKIDRHEIGIEDFNVKLTNRNTRAEVSFRLVNNKMERVISGYVVLFGRLYDKNITDYTSFPASVELNEDMEPIVYTNGEYYSILRFKPINAVLMLPQKLRQLDFIVAVVYTLKGEILYRNVYEVKDFVS